MGFKDVNEQIEWEARRVAAAFGNKNWQFVPATLAYDGGSYWSSLNLNGEFSWSFIEDSLMSISIGDIGRELCTIYRAEPQSSEWCINLGANLNNESMARGLYCLGFEDDIILEALALLSAHQKLELRLSMPREFWPQTWLMRKRSSLH